VRIAATSAEIDRFSGVFAFGEAFRLARRVNDEENELWDCN
jgi:hypothetical protein